MEPYLVSTERVTGLAATTQRAAGSWKVSTRPFGDVMITEVSVPELIVVLFMDARRQSREQVEDRLHSLVEAALQAPPPTIGRRMIPPVTHHVVRSLLEWEEGLESEAGEEIFWSLIFSHSISAPAIAHIGGEEPRIETEDGTHAPQGLTMRGQAGRQARALCLRAGRLSRISMTWSAGLLGSHENGASVEAEWLSKPPEGDDDQNQPSGSTLVVDRDASLSPPAVPTQDVATTDEVLGLIPSHTAGVSYADSVATAEAPTEEPADWPRLEPVDEPGLEPSRPDLAPRREILGSVPSDAIEDTFGRRDGATFATATPDQFADLSRFLEMDAPALKFGRSGSEEESPGEHAKVHELEPTPTLELEAVLKPDPLLEPELVLESVMEPAPVTVSDPVPVPKPPSPALEHSPENPVSPAHPLRAVHPMVAVGAQRPAGVARTAEPTQVVRPALRPLRTKTQRSAPTRRPPTRPWSVGDFAPTPQRILMLLGAIVAVAIFAVGWILGDVHLDGTPKASPLQALGLGGARFECRVQSDPEGAAIAVDGKKTGRTTPAKLALSPGEHTITIGTGQWGAINRIVRGRPADRTTVEAPLWGTIAVQTSRASTPVLVWVDDQRRGTTPITIGHLEPGPHEVRFSTPGDTPWGKTVEVRVQKTTDVVADPFVEPATGSIEIRAAFVDDSGIEKVAKVKVWVDGKPRGLTPLTLELPHGPHSIRATHREEDSPVTVINLPGGNKRFVNLRFGTGIRSPRLVLLEDQTPTQSNRVTKITAQLDGVGQSELKEMWLYTRDRDENWRRYPMSLLPASRGTVGVTVLPAELLKEPRPAPYYVCALTNVGDEYFTEMQNPEGLTSAVNGQGPTSTR